MLIEKVELCRNVTEVRFFGLTRFQSRNGSATFFFRPLIISNGKNCFKVDLGGKKQLFSFGEKSLNVEVCFKIERILTFADYQDSDAGLKKKEIQIESSNIKNEH